MSRDTKGRVQVGSLDRFEVVTVHRSELRNAEYNPRVISEKERLKLRRGIERHGMLAPITWNATTGRIVGGHQRVSILDSLYGTKDYSLKVARVELDESREKEANLLLNNPESSGSWDLVKLEELLKDTTLELDGTGFDLSDTHRLFGDTPGGDGLAEGMAEAFSEIDARTRDTAQRVGNRDDPNFFAVLVFRDVAERDAFLSSLGLAQEMFQDGRVFAELVARRQLGLAAQP